MIYFKEFPMIDFPMTIDGVKRIVNVPDIFVRFKIFDKIKQDPFSVYEF